MILCTFVIWKDYYIFFQKYFITIVPIGQHLIYKTSGVLWAEVVKIEDPHTFFSLQIEVVKIKDPLTNIFVIFNWYWTGTIYFW